MKNGKQAISDSFRKFLTLATCTNLTASYSFLQPLQLIITFTTPYNFIPTFQLRNNKYITFVTYAKDTYRQSRRNSFKGNAFRA